MLRIEIICKSLNSTQSFALQILHTLNAYWSMECQGGTKVNRLKSCSYNIDAIFNYVSKMEAVGPDTGDSLTF